jgi:hypothetical protein
MEQEDRLDALLALHLHGGGSAGATLLEDDTVAAALAAADYLIGLRVVEPEETFARNLETRLLAHAQSLATVAPAVPAIAAQQKARPRPPAPSPGGRRTSPRTRVPWPLIAASLALVMGIGTITGVVAAAAQPGSPLYALHRWEQGVQVQLAPTAADRVHLHLANAHAALASLTAAVAHREGDPTYRDALATLQSEEHAAATALQTLPPGNERDNLTGQLQTLRQQERSDLYAALSGIAWPDQLVTTQALGSLGAAIPQVTSVTLKQLAPGGVRGWKVTITGSGFLPGAELIGSGGTVVGQVTASGPTQLIVDISDSERHLLARGAGVRNPDDTAAALGALIETGSGKGSAGGPQGTPSPGGSGNGNGGGTHGGGHQPTPSPSVPRGR